MYEVRACSKDEFPKLIDVVNKIFRPLPECKPTMLQEYPLLLGESNLEHMLMIKVDEKPVANVNFYNYDIMIEGIPIKAASIGAVGTDEEYRGKGYSSKLLNYAEELMLKENTNVMLVSGGRGLYLRRGCVRVGTAYSFKVKPEELKTEDIKIIEYTENDFDELVNLYNKDTTRYYRSYEEFKSLLDACQKYGRASTVKTFLVNSENGCKGYMVLYFYYEEDATYAVVKECSGEPNIIYKALKDICHQYCLSYIKIVGTKKSNMAEAMKEVCDDYETVNLGRTGTIKIFNFEGLMNELAPYFRQYTTKDVVESIYFEEKEGKYIIRVQGESLQIENIEVLTKLIFGDKDQSFHEILGKSLNNKSKIKKFLQAVFPLAFPWTENLNYQ